jgi:cytochrome o ubiquinol oxidase subunit 2
MSKKYRIVFIVTAILLAIGLLAIIISHGNVAILNPKGAIALHERNLIVTAILLMLIVVIPIFTLLGVFAWKYRAGNKSAKYTPDWNHNIPLQLVWWAIPAIVISTLAVINWNTTHALDPYKPLESATKPLTIQVVALRWKWLFIYPEQNIATVNYIQFPEKTPINFELTADAPMSSFWIPSLGGQMYAMSGMVTKLHLIANEQGKFDGSAAEINGAGFAGMKFIARSSSRKDFDTWVNDVREAPSPLDSQELKSLSQPSENIPVTYYSSVEEGLYNGIIEKFMEPQNSTTERENMQHTY